MESFIRLRSDRFRILHRVWLLAVLVAGAAGVYWIDRHLRTPEPVRLAASPTRTEATVEPLVPASLGPRAGVGGRRPIPMVRSDDRYMRHVRRTYQLYHPIIERAANRYGVEPALVKAIIMAESGYDPRAVSRRGAIGLMQIMPHTARYLGVADSFDPEHNITTGVRYFRQLMDTVAQEPALALAAYNAGPRKVRRYNGVPPYEATRHYIKKVMAYYLCYRDIGRQEQYPAGKG